MMDENMDFKLFDEYIEYITRRIMSNKKKAEVCDEYYSHLMEEYERHTYLGKSHIEAQVFAVESMGNKDVIKEQFGELYSVIPYKYMKSSLNLIIWGVLLSSFQINLFFEGFMEIVEFIGSALLLLGLFKIRKTDKKLNVAFFMTIGIELIGIVGAHIGRTLIDPDNFILGMGPAIIVLGLIMYGFMFAGINNLCKTLKGDGMTQPKLLLGYISYCLFGLSILLAMFGAVVLVYFALLFLILPLWQLRNARNVLANVNEEFELKTVIDVGEKILYCVLILSIAVMPIISMFAVAGSQPEFKEYNPVDTSYTADEVNHVKFEMVVLGMPEDILDDLPDSEIMKYKGATHLEIVCGEKWDRSGKNVWINFSSYIFFFDNGRARSLLCADIDDKSVLKYRNGLYLMHSNNGWNRVSTGEEDEFYLVLCNKAGETVTSEIISTYEPKMLSFDSVEGMEFKFPKGSVHRRAYISHQIVVKDYDDEQLLSVSGMFLCEQQPLTTNWQSANSAVRNMYERTPNTSSLNLGNFQYMGFGYSFEYKPEQLETAEN